MRPRMIIPECFQTPAALCKPRAEAQILKNMEAEAAKRDFYAELEKAEIMRQSLRANFAKRKPKLP